MFTFDPSKQCLGFFIRHGELKNMHVWDGWSEMDLSAEGLEQAEKVAQWLSFEHLGRAISSDVRRTIHTAQATMDTGIVECPYLATDPNLRAWNVAHFTGMEKTPERLAEFKKYLDDTSLVIPDGESHDQFVLRIQVIWQYMAAPYKGLPTAMFLHNSVIKGIMGLDDIRDAVSPGGVIAVYMDEKGEISYEIKLGHPTLEKGVS